MDRKYNDNCVLGDRWPFDNVSFCSTLFLEFGNDFPSFNFDSLRCIVQPRELPRAPRVAVIRESFFILNALDMFLSHIIFRKLYV